jgi:GDP-D-mannose 3',5'-epimerase
VWLLLPSFVLLNTYIHITHSLIYIYTYILDSFHNVYGPFGTWKGGREKAPAAFCRKAAASTECFEVWGDGEQTRSFMYVDDCVEGVLRIMMSDFIKPLNLGTEEMVSMNEFADIAMSFENKKLPIKHIPGPQGVRGRNSDNTLIREQLGWEPNISIQQGLRETYFWIKGQIEKERAAGIHYDYSSSKVVIQTTDSLDALGKMPNNIPESDENQNLRVLS